MKGQKKSMFVDSVNGNAEVMLGLQSEGRMVTSQSQPRHWSTQQGRICIPVRPPLSTFDDARGHSTTHYQGYCIKASCLDKPHLEADTIYSTAGTEHYSGEPMLWFGVESIKKHYSNLPLESINLS